MPARLIFLVAATVVATTVALSERNMNAATAKETATEVRFTRVKLGTGVELQVAQRGPVDGEPVLFLHGYTDSWFSFAPVLERLPANVRAIVPTQRGHGDSQRPKCCYRFEDFANDAAALLDALNIPRATVVGHSMGSFVAQRLAIDHPTRVTRLVLIGSGAYLGTKPVKEFAETLRQLKEPVSREFIREFQAGTAHQPLPPSFLEGAIRETSKLPVWVWRDVMAAMLAGDARQELKRIAAPTLVVWGAHDALFVRADQDELVRAIPNAKLLVYEEAAHSPNWEEPARFTRDLIDFIGTPVRGVSPEQRHDATHKHSDPGAKHSNDIPLLTGLGDWHRAVTTKSEQAQQYFDQGLRLSYGFNFDESARSFERAIALDPSCAMCYWGLAHAIGPNINAPLDPGIEPKALAAIKQAQKLAADVTPVERALIDAMAVRFGEPAGAARAKRDSAYANAMRSVARRFPEDIDAQVLFADAMMNLRPWSYWTREGNAQPGTEELVGALTRALQQQPEHAGACHFYIHAVEASATPERAVPCAERLGRLMPGAGHIVHMPAHVFLRVGRYEDAARTNIAAVEADNRYFEKREVAGAYPMFYAPHNLHFLWSAYQFSGQRAKALGAARALNQRVAIDAAKQIPSLQVFLPSVILTHARFRDWNAVLAEPAPDRDLRFYRGMWHYARGLARAGKGEVTLARTELDSVRAIATQLKDDVIIVLNPGNKVLRLASEILAGEIASKQKRYDQAITHFENAVRIEDSLTFDEPPAWYHPARQFLGETLLDAGRPIEAEKAFRDDLFYQRETGWSLSGLERALRAQGKAREAGQIAQRFKAAWRFADVSVN